ncbi:hypothetical protein BJY01DRAFT_250197 [Aspergillus pseudoustus]|uniref:Uncharacterized protein n=1 Tax=Aspergillus pseudoustus TaxID=1810923 RepID=A0ABR4JJ54_9EURO
MSDSEQDSNQSPPPVYSSAAENDSLAASIRTTPGANLHKQSPFIDFTGYRIAGGVLDSSTAPKALIRIRGSHSVYGEVKSDFNLTLNLLPLLVSETERWPYLRIDGGRVTANGEPSPPVEGITPSDLEKLVVQYCEDPTPIKSFSLKRRIVNLDYDCVEVVWPFANVPSNSSGWRCAVQSKQDWWARWKDAVRTAVLAKRHGHVTLKDRIDVDMGVPVPEPGKDWGATK